MKYIMYFYLLKGYTTGLFFVEITPFFSNTMEINNPPRWNNLTLFYTVKITTLYVERCCCPTIQSCCGKPIKPRLYKCIGNAQYVKKTQDSQEKLLEYLLVHFQTTLSSVVSKSSSYSAGNFKCLFWVANKS